VTGKIFKIKVVDGTYSAEVEGDWEQVNENFIKRNGIEIILRQAYKASRNIEKSEGEWKGNSNTETLNSKYRVMHERSIEKTEPIDLVEPSAVDDLYDSYGALAEVVKNDFGGREIEWLLVYCFYASDFGKADFSREDIIALYEETGRSSLSRKRNLSNNLHTLQKYKWIRGSNTVYSITDEGILRARGILVRESSSEKNIIN